MVSVSVLFLVAQLGTSGGSYFLFVDSIAERKTMNQYEIIQMSKEEFLREADVIFDLNISVTFN